MSDPTPKNRPPLPDQAARDRILCDLGTTLLVEAAAGTGKTTSMVGRMVALLETGACDRVEHLAAVTFTRKAAAELRGRFQVELERRARETSGAAARRLATAASHIERCFIGTIHSFCARLLRERPVEAGVDVSFEEIDDVDDGLLRREAWDRFVAELHAGDDPLLGELIAMRLEPADLREAFLTFADYPDVAEWPAGPEVPHNPQAVGAAVLEYVEHMGSFTFPRDKGTDQLMNCYEIIPLIARAKDVGDPADIAELLLEFDRSAKITQKNWPGKDGAARAKAERDRWEAFRETVVTPALDAWRRACYATAIECFEGARAVYDRLRRERGVLNFQDLLLGAARLLRENTPHIRAYFNRRFTHLLVDEFQDTDPIQAEVMLLLTADDPNEADWRRCRPRPGALFVVGDPKQSIYRFRRADLVTYNEVQSIIRRAGGDVVELSTNFRSAPPVIDWVNDAFAPRFPDEENDVQPRYVPLQPGRAQSATPWPGVQAVRVPETHTTKEEVTQHDADLVARTIRAAVDAGLPVPDPAAEGGTRPARPGDFMIISARKNRLSFYARTLQALGLPNHVTGGTALNEVDELALLHLDLAAVVDPDNPVALVAALRSPLYGLSDAALYACAAAGGTFHIGARVPEAVPEEHRAPMADALARLRRHARWLGALPPVAAVEKVIADLGLAASAAAAPAGHIQAGSLAKAVELLRDVQETFWTPADIVAYLGRLAQAEEKHDGQSVAHSPEPPVRIMNLHKAKGLQAPVVFLADPSGRTRHPVTLHIDRSGDAPRGFMTVTVPTAGFGPDRLLARPADWETWRTREEAFQEAERVRLLYVAATRAGAHLLVTQRAKGNHWNPWQDVVDALAEAPELPDPGPQQAPAVDAATLTPEDVRRARENVAGRWAAVTRPSYTIAAARRIALGEGPRTGAGEHGTEWGKVIHLVLEARMKDPTADLKSLAESALRDQELEVDRAPDVLQVVESVTQSAIWRRATASPHRLVEVPFVCDGDEGLVRGVIDLAFEEEGAWVIVDYKTDSRAVGELAAVAAHYRPQLETYAAVWQRSVGAPVKECGLYFTRPAEYVSFAADAV